MSVLCGFLFFLFKNPFAFSLALCYHLLTLSDAWVLAYRTSLLQSLQKIHLLKWEGQSPTWCLCKGPAALTLPWTVFEPRQYCPSEVSKCLPRPSLSKILGTHLTS